MTIAKSVLDQFKAALPDYAFCDDAKIIKPHLSEWRDKFVGASPVMLTPRSTQEIQTIIKLANQTHTKIALQGGNTGLVGGSTPGLEDRDEILLSTTKMAAISAPCPLSQTMVVEAGSLLASVQAVAEGADMMFPLSLASEGSCTIGGNLATNAGGIHVIKYGTMRALVVGIEAVLPDGTLFNNLQGLIKDNSGYDLMNLLIGAEGTLGVITKARLKLSPLPKTKVTGWLSLASAEAALMVLPRLQQFSAHHVSAYELMGKMGLDFVHRHLHKPLPIEPLADWSVLFDLSSAEQRPDWQEGLTDLLGDMLTEGLILDATLATSESQRQALWALREGMSEAQKHEGGSIKHDISLPIPRLAEFLSQAPEIVEKLVPNCRPTPFGHLGDGNLHYNIMQPEGMDKAEFLQAWPMVSQAVHDLTCAMGGSISAEHGIGTLKRDELAIRDREKVAVMKAVKRALDPNEILNIGRMIAL